MDNKRYYCSYAPIHFHDLISNIFIIVSLISYTITLHVNLLSKSRYIIFPRKKARSNFFITLGLFSSISLGLIVLDFLGFPHKNCYIGWETKIFCSYAPTYFYDFISYSLIIFSLVRCNITLQLNLHSKSKRTYPPKEA